MNAAACTDSHAASITGGSPVNLERECKERKKHFSAIIAEGGLKELVQINRVAEREGGGDFQCGSHCQKNEGIVHFD